MQIGIVAVSSKDKDPIGKFVDLFNTNQLPSLLNDDAMDPKILKYFLLVHDNQDGMVEKYNAISFFLGFMCGIDYLNIFRYFFLYVQCAAFDCDSCKKQVIGNNSLSFFLNFSLVLAISHLEVNAFISVRDVDELCFLSWNIHLLS